MLYQPKNDDVLFTFFGVSLRIRRQSAAAEVPRRRLVVKRKAMRLLDGKFGIEVLIRDGSDEKTTRNSDDAAEGPHARRWSVYRYEDSGHHDGLHFLRVVLCLHRRRQGQLGMLPKA